MPSRLHIMFSADKTPNASLSTHPGCFGLILINSVFTTLYVLSYLHPCPNLSHCQSLTLFLPHQNLYLYGRRQWEVCIFLAPYCYLQTVLLVLLSTKPSSPEVHASLFITSFSISLSISNICFKTMTQKSLMTVAPNSHFFSHLLCYYGQLQQLCGSLKIGKELPGIF